MSGETYDSSYEMEEEEDEDLEDRSGTRVHTVSADMSFEDKSATLKPSSQAVLPTSATFPNLDEERHIMLKVNQSVDFQDQDDKHINRVYSDKSIYYSSVNSKSFSFNIQFI